MSKLKCHKKIKSFLNHLIYCVCLLICCVSEFKCVDLRAINRRTRTRLHRTTQMGGGRRRQRTQVRTVSIACMFVCERALMFDQCLLCNPSWITADERACARTHADLFLAAVLWACTLHRFVSV